MYPASGIVSGLVFLFFISKCIESENNNENTNNTKNDTIEKQKLKNTKNKISPMPMASLINFLFKMSFVYTQRMDNTVVINSKFITELIVIVEEFK